MLDDKPCECCGKAKVAIGYNDVCPICGWEDDEFQCDDPDLEGGANELSLNQYRAWYRKKIKKQPDWIWHNDIIKYNFGKRKPAKLKRKVTAEDAKKYNKWNTLDKL